MRRTPPAYIDLIHWLKFNGYAQTTGEAKRLIMEDRVMSESHVVGKGTARDEGDVPVIVLDPYISADLRYTLQVIE